jgi:hypothetical protein
MISNDASHPRTRRGDEVQLSRLPLTRDQILGHRRRVSALDARLPAGAASLEQAAWAGLQDSMPRSALLSLHARVEGVAPETWEHPALVQLWGPRFSVYVVAARDRAVFTVGRYPDDARGRRVAEEMAARLQAYLAGRRVLFDDAAANAVPHGDPNRMRYAAPTGTVAMRWDGARQPLIWNLPRPDVEPNDARRELARRYLHIFGPTTPAAFAVWAGISPAQGRVAFDDLAASAELTAVTTPLGDAFILAADEASFRATASHPAAVRLLPSGDTFYLLQGADRELLVPDAAKRPLLWTTRVWPGALLISGQVAGTWRRDQGRLTIETWRRLSPAERLAVESEAASLPLPGLRGSVGVTWG